MKTRFLLKPFFFFASAIVSLIVSAQGLTPAELHKPLENEWLSYSGDYTGQRYSRLDQVNRENVKNLTLAWTARMNPNIRSNGQVVTVQGGEGDGNYLPPGANLKGSFIMMDDVLYVTSPDHVWAMDARDGTELWHYFWHSRGGIHIGNRGPAIWNDSLFFETPDNYLVSLNIYTGQENWHVEIAPLEQQYFSTMAPLVVNDHLLVGTGNDLDSPGYLQSFDPATGELQWKFHTTPQNPGDPGLDTWPNLDAARNGGGQVWVTGVYDPDTNYYIFSTGNPTPGYTGVARPGDNLFTCTLIAVDIDTGEMVWYHQTSPHDTHDWDSAQTPVLIDGEIDGEPRKLVSTAARNGYFFTLDRLTGESIVTEKYGSFSNWDLGVREDGSPIPNPEKEAIIPGSIVSPVEGGVANWQPPAYNPDLGLFYTHENNGFNILYLTDPDPRGSMGLGGKQVAVVGFEDSAFNALDYRTGKPVWRHEWPSTGAVGIGVLSTAGGLVFTGDGSGNMVAFDGANGDLLWHTRIGNLTNAPQTYMVDGRQHLLVAVRDTLYSFVLY